MIRLLTRKDISLIVNAFSDIGWNKPTSTFQTYYDEQQRNERFVWVAFNENNFRGYVTLKLKSEYPIFGKNKMPEINDLNVLPSFRNQGIGTALLDIAENEAKKHHSTVGIGVGLYADYGSAQKLYVKRGYIPNGQGITYQYKDVLPGNAYSVDDDLILWFIKNL